jgi:flagellar motility protein MotE (MotC chaperone)
MLKIPTPRLLPATITAMAALLLLKCGVLLQTAVSHGPKPDAVMVAAANAASTDQTKEPAKPPPPPAQPKPAAPIASAPPPAQNGPAPISDSERALLQDLRQRRQELDARAAAIDTRESVLVASEQKLTARLTELQALQQKLEGLDAADKQKEDAGWQGLVKLYEDMKPQDAATIFNDLAMPVLLQVLGRMKDAKAATVMAAMNPEKAREVTTGLARIRTGHDVSGTPAGGPNPKLAGG